MKFFKNFFYLKNTPNFVANLLHCTEHYAAYFFAEKRVAAAGWKYNADFQTELQMYGPFHRWPLFADRVRMKSEMAGL